MIEIHRSRPFLRVGDVTLKLSHDEHILITILGMMDNRIAPHDLLLEVIYPLGQGGSSQNVLWQKMHRLRKKVGSQHLRIRRRLGYILTGPVRFVDEL